jgi:hypothetical protein
MSTHGASQSPEPEPASIELDFSSKTAFLRTLSGHYGECRTVLHTGSCWAEWEEALPPAADRVIEDAGVRDALSAHFPVEQILTPNTPDTSQTKTECRWNRVAPGSAWLSCRALTTPSDISRAAAQKQVSFVPPVRQTVQARLCPAPTRNLGVFRALGIRFRASKTDGNFHHAGWIGRGQVKGLSRTAG